MPLDPGESRAAAESKIRIVPRISSQGPMALSGRQVYQFYTLCGKDIRFGDVRYRLDNKR
jgi:hypothetical protein